MAEKVAGEADALKLPRRRGLGGKSIEETG